jgi:hypothetical protein
MQQEKTLLRRWLLEAVPILRTKDIATTMLRAAMAGLCGLVIDLTPVVVGEELTCRDIPDRHNPDGLPRTLRILRIVCSRP